MNCSIVTVLRPGTLLHASEATGIARLAVRNVRRSMAGMKVPALYRRSYAEAWLFLPLAGAFALSALAAFAAVFRASADWAPKRFVNRSTRPSVSISFWRPVKNGWQTLQISRCSSVLVERVLNVFPHAHRTSTSWYFG